MHKHSLLGLTAAAALPLCAALSANAQYQPQPNYVVATVQQPTVYAAQPPAAVKSTAGTQAAAILVLGVYGPNTRAVCQAGSAGVAYYTCRQLVSYNPHYGTGQNHTTNNTVVANDGSVAAQPSGSFYGARGYRKKLVGDASSYCQHLSLYGGESVCLVDGGSSYEDGAWAKVHFKRSGS